jgi:hypothetical protein
MGTFGADPYGDPDAFRQASLRTFPPGTPWSVLDEQIAHTRKDKCKSGAREVVCTWSFAKGWLFDEVFQMEFLLDQQQKLADVRAGQFRKWF